MPSNSQPAKASKWSVGSFLQQAVAGVESRLDTILAENDDDETVNEGNKQEKQTEQSSQWAGKQPEKLPSASLSRSSSSARMNDRLQERLARAMVKQSGLPTNVASTTSSMGVPSRTASPLTLNESRSSVDASPETSENLEEKDEISAQSDSTHAAISVHKKSGKLSVGTEGNTESELRQPTIDGESGVSDIITATSSSDPVPAIGVTAPLTEIGTDLGPALLQLQAEHEASEARWQEELHGYVERIDALQAKLKYLAKEAAESAKIAAASASPGSPEKKLFEKDERIAALMEEGQKLSKMELDHRATIKKLRRFIAEKAKSEADAKRRIDILENDLSRAEEKAQRCELAEQRALVKVHAQTRLERDLAAVTNERDNLSVRITDLNSQISKALARAEAAERKAQSDSTAAERRRVAELKDDLSSAKIEREISEEKLRREIRDLKETLEREKERSRVQETELQGELSVLEGKMETLRARAEEVSSSATGDAQAKLLRQIERLQTQYAVARENWNGIETSLITRLANVEKERDEIARREGDLRRKVREANLKVKRMEGETESHRDALQEMERDLEETKQEVKKLARKLEEAEIQLREAKQDLESQKELQEAIISQRLEQEKLKWNEQLSSPVYLHPSNESPVLLNRRSETLTSPSDRPSSRRSPMLPLFPPGQNTPPRQNSYSSFNSGLGLRHPSHDASSLSLELPSVQTLEPEEYFAGAITPATPSAHGTHQSRGINDIMSASTVAAGPSVQLVERMSATVRRLESERAASKDELACITAQRDEARQEVVELMREVEEKRTCDTRIQELEAKVRDLDERYQTTLELLGEKSELVEEQKADIEDLKKIYRELVESTIK